MSRLQQILEEVDRRSLWQILLVYVGISYAVLEAVDLFSQRFGLPDWLFALAFVLLCLGLPIIVATALAQRVSPATPNAEKAPLSEMARPTARRMFTWRRAITGGLLAFSLWGLVATGWLLFAERPDASRAVSPDDRKMLVVLPFENLGPTEQDYFADGITEEITSRLAAISGLGVISRTSALQYKGTDRTLRQIGEELGVDYVVEGTILWQQPEGGPSRVRVTPQLIRAADDTHVWADRYDAVLSDIFAVQTEIARQIIGALDVALLAGERETIETRPTENLEAYDYYLRGREYATRSIRREDLELGVEFFERAVDRDPDFALAWANLAIANDYVYWFSYDRTTERRARVKQTADRALQLDPNLAKAHLALAYYHYHVLLDYSRALDALGRARELRPNDAEVWAAIGYVQRRHGNWDEAALSLDRALVLDPRSSRTAWNQCLTYAVMRSFEKAETYCDRAIELAPDVVDGYVAKALLYLSWQGGGEGAREALRLASERSDRTTFVARLFFQRFDVPPIFRVEGEYASALASLKLETFDADTAGYYLSHTSLAGLRPSLEAERAMFDSARAELERHLPYEGDDPLAVARTHSLLGLALAGLGRKEEAIRHGKQALELLPLSKSSWEGAYAIKALAEIYVMVGEFEPAIERLEFLLTIPSDLTVAQLRADPLYDPLRDHPRFQAILETYRLDSGSSR